MMENSDNLSLYNLTIQEGSEVTRAIHGRFSGGKEREIILAKGKVLEMVKIVQENGSKKIRSILTQEVYMIVRSISTVHLKSAVKDYILIGGDSGQIMALEYSPDRNRFDIRHVEKFGRTGCRRAIAGQYLALDPKGRAAMIAAFDNQKLVYVINRDEGRPLFFSSPQNVSKRSTILYDVVGIDNDYGSARFACLELDYEDADDDHTGRSAVEEHQMVAYYEFDFGTNCVKRVESIEIEERANMLIPVPGNPNLKGVLVCSENFITYRHSFQEAVRCPIPRRRNDLSDPNRGIIINCYAILSTKKPHLFVQTEQGDLFRVEVLTNEEESSEIVTEIQMQYFDTVPNARSICFFTDCIFVASEYGNHCLYKIEVDENNIETTFSSAIISEETSMFDPRPLKNLILIDEIESLCPLNGCVVEDSFRLHAICGKGPISTLKTLHLGLKTEVQSSHDLPQKPNAIWTLKKDESCKHDSFIVLGFSHSTLVLEVTDEVTQTEATGFLSTTSTLACAMFGDGTLVQVHSEGIRQIKRNKAKTEWKPSNNKKITNCATNQSQIVIILNDKELVYFEYDPMSGIINEISERQELSANVRCIAMGRVPKGLLTSKFLAIGLENVVQVMSLDKHEIFSVLNIQAIPSIPQSISISEICGNHYLYVGLQNGVLTRNNLDSVTGDLSDARTCYIGPRPLTFTKIDVGGSEALLVLSERTWMIYANQNKLNLVPLSCESLDIASGFDRVGFTCNIIGIVGSSLQVLNMENFGNIFNQTSTPLSYTPRKIALHKPSTNVIITECDYKTYTADTKLAKKNEMVQELMASVEEDQKEFAMDIAEKYLNDNLPETTFGEPKGGEGEWASVIRIVDTNKLESVYNVTLEQNVAAVSLCLLRFSKHPDNDFVIVGVAKNLNVLTGQKESAAIHAYHLVDEGTRLELVHKTPVDGVPHAMCSFGGMILVGVGRYLVLYDLGMRKMLKKCENKQIPNLIADIKTLGNRILVSDVHESTFFLTLKKVGNLKKLMVFADDQVPRKVVTTCFLDYHTIAGSDKFGNIWISRLPPNVNDEVEDDPTGSMWERGHLNGSSQKLSNEATFYVGEMVTSITKTKLSQYGNEVVLYTTISGGIGMLLPIKTLKRYQRLQNLEWNLRNNQFSTNTTCRHIKFRSTFHPIKNVVDGDFCEEFNCLDSSIQNDIADNMDEEKYQILKIVENMRMSVFFEQ